MLLDGDVFILLFGLASSCTGKEEHANPGEGPGTRNFAWLAPGTAESRRSYCHIEIREGRLRLESNSRQRIERGRQLLETSAGAHL